MTQLLRLAWKEAHPVRWFIYAGFGALFVPMYFSLIEGAMQSQREGHDLAIVLDIVIAALSILIAVGLTRDDLDGPVAVFFHSRPARLGQIMAVKFGVGLLAWLLVLAAAMTLGLLIESVFALGFPRSAFSTYAGLIIGHLPMLMLVYGVTFFVGTITPNAPAAALAGLTAGLVFFFLPMLAPPLASIGPITVGQSVARKLTEHYSAPRSNPIVENLLLHSLLACGIMLFSTLGLASLAFLAAARQWRWRPSVTSLAWTLGGTAMLLYLSFAWQVGSDLQARVVLPAAFDNPSEIYIRSAGEYGWVVGRGMGGQPATVIGWRYQNGQINFFTPKGVLAGLGKTYSEFFGSIDTGESFWFYETGLMIGNIAFNPNDPSIIYIPLYDRKDQSFFIAAVQTDPDGQGRVLGQVHLPGTINVQLPRLIVESGRLFVIWDTIVMTTQPDDSSPRVTHVATFELGSSGQPPLRLVGVDQVGTDNNIVSSYGSAVRRISKFSGLTPPENLSLQTHFIAAFWATDIQRDLLVESYNPNDPDVEYLAEGLRTFTVDKFENGLVHLTSRGVYHPAPLESQFEQPIFRLYLRDGLVYALHGGPTWLGMEKKSPLGLGFGLVIYDVHDPAYIRRVGHFSIAGDHLRAIAPLPDGRTLAAGKNLYLIDAPRVK